MEGCPRRRRWRRGPWRSVPIDEAQKPREIVFLPTTIPTDMFRPGEVVELYPEELAALKLIYMDDLEVDEAALKLGLSKATMWRILDSGRRKIVEAIIRLKPVRIILSENLSQEQNRKV
ncbi:MAG: DUF134 domain-containing protein [Thermofilum sp.]|jgi:predicted DNA-binding protein (UPF0251 family)|nr:DUF134 domain-containing protein [Thermofilum sp.]